MPAFEPANPRFESVVRDSFARQAFMATLGATLERVAPGTVEIALAATGRLTQQDGFVHAGALASIADSACGYAAFTLAPAGHGVLSVEFKINLLAPALGDRFVARARVVRPGRTLTVCSAEVVAYTERASSRAAPGETVVAAVLSTLIIRPARGRPPAG